MYGVKNYLETCCLFVGVVFLVVNCAFLSKWFSPHFQLSMSFALYLRHGCGKRMVYYFRGSYRAPRWILYFEGRIARREGYYLSRVVSCAATDAWTDMSPMGPELRDSGCVSLGKTCITIFDIASHGITHFIIDELEHVFC